MGPQSIHEQFTGTALPAKPISHPTTAVQVATGPIGTGGMAIGIGMAGMPLLGAWVRVEWRVADVLSCHEKGGLYWAKMRQASLFHTSTGNRCDYIALRWEHQGAKVGTPVLIG